MNGRHSVVVVPVLLSYPVLLCGRIQKAGGESGLCSVGTLRLAVASRLFDFFPRLKAVGAR